MAEDGSDDGEDCSCWENEELGVGVCGGLGPIDKVGGRPIRAHKRGCGDGSAWPGHHSRDGAC